MAAYNNVRTEAQREYARAWMRQHRAKHPEFAMRQSVSTRRWQLANPVRFALTNTKKGAIRRGIEWRLPDGLAIDLITDVCLYCAAGPEPTNGIDRVDNAIGYLESNVVTACARCNYAKRDFGLGDWLTWARRLASRMDQLGGI